MLPRPTFVSLITISLAALGLGCASLSAQQLKKPDFETKPQHGHAPTNKNSMSTSSSGAARAAASVQNGEFPKNNPQDFMKELKVLQADGSVYRTPREDWEGARHRVAEDPQWQQWLAARRHSIDDWMGKHSDRTSWNAGWWHDFVSPQDGSYLVWTEQIPGEQTDTLLSRSGHQVEITPKIMDAWVFLFRERHLVNMVEAARLWQLTGEQKYADWVITQMDFYADNKEAWPQKSVAGRAKTRLGSQSLEDATWMVHFVEAARLLKDHVSDEQKQHWLQNLFLPQVDVLDQSFNNIHNIATWHRAAAAQVALLYNDQTIWQRAVDGPSGLRAQLRRGVTSDYFWYEQSMGYNNYLVRATQSLLSLAALLGEKERLAEEAAVLQNLMLAPLAIRFADGSLPNPADSDRQTIPLHAIASNYRTLPTSIGLYNAANLRNWDTLLDPPTQIANFPQRKPELPPVKSLSMDSSRFALLKKGPWQVFFHYGQVNRSHSQAEALNWSASFNGTDVSHDPGTVGYGSALYRGYFTRGLNHNVPLVNGEGQSPWHPGQLLSFDADAGVVSAAQPAYSSDAAATRTLRIEGERLIDEVTVTATDGEATLGLALHLQGKVSLPDNFRLLPGGDADFSANRPEPFRHWKEIKVAEFTDVANASVELADGQVLSLTFATTGNFRLYQGSSPDYAPKYRSAFYIEKVDPARTATFITELAPAAAANQQPPR